MVFTNASDIPFDCGLRAGTCSPFQQLISSTSLDHRSFDIARRMRPVCALPLRRLIDLGNFHPFMSINRAIRFKLYPVPKSRLTIALTLRAP